MNCDENGKEFFLFEAQDRPESPKPEDAKEVGSQFFIIFINASESASESWQKFPFWAKKKNISNAAAANGAGRIRCVFCGSCQPALQQMRQTRGCLVQPKHLFEQHLAI
jgi:hypothetical protein